MGEIQKIFQNCLKFLGCPQNFGVFTKKIDLQKMI